MVQLYGAILLYFNSLYFVCLTMPALY